MGPGSSTRSRISNSERVAQEHSQALNTVTITAMSKRSVNNVVRPCFSLTEEYDDLITYQEWMELDLHSRYYLERFRESPQLYECPFNGTRVLDHSEEDQFEIYRIFGHIDYSTGRPAFFLVQYVCDHENFSDDERFEFLECGEISWQSFAYVREYRYIDQYLKEDPKYFDKIKRQFGSIRQFQSRETERGKGSSVVCSGVHSKLLKAIKSFYGLNDLNYK